jgi:hypothetical protein
MHFTSSESGLSFRLIKHKQFTFINTIPFLVEMQKRQTKSFGDPRPAKWVKIPPEIKWETPMAAQVIAAVHGDLKE